jgi:DNA polymerase
MHDAKGAAALAALLDWYREAGADEAVGEAAIDWLARGNAGPGHAFWVASDRGAVPPRPSPAPTQPAAVRAPQPPPVSRLPPAPPRQFAAPPADTAVMAARAAARQAATLDALAATLAAFEGCALKATAKNLCFYRGAPKARVMLIGEAPGREEDLEGKPFVGRAGQLLDKMLAAIGLSEADVHITNIVYWRPPGNRTPTPHEAQVCRPFLERQVELVAPELVVLLGGAAAKHVLDVTEGIMRIRGKWREIEIGAARVRTIATLHPAYLLRTPAAKRLAWRDLLAVRAQLDAAG